MKQDAFSRCHPAVSFLFFILVMLLGVLIQHPAFVAASVCAALAYYLLLTGTKGLKLLLISLPLIIAVAVLNPLMNHTGRTVLFTVFSIPYTLESLIYGTVLSGIFLLMILWCGCYGAVMTSDKFTSLFANLIPALSLLLVMVLRMIPNFMRKGRQITGARMAIGKSVAGDAKYSEKAKNGMLLLGSLTDWALEGSIVTADSMRSRGYGTKKRTSFLQYRFTLRDGILVFMTLFLGAGVVFSMLRGDTAAAFTPLWDVAPLSPFGLGCYLLLLLLPTFLHLKEALTWHILRSGI
ncbi:MAG: hypothetical protein IJN00_04655 [Clostridia bacterium]|nr:hypothetical protein [Clostridia bacterium]